MKYAIATFSFGDRYANQTNRFIRSFEQIENPPMIFIVSNKLDKIIKRPFVKVYDIKLFEPDYEYVENYYTFDFSVKRYSLKMAFDEGYENVILTDTDVVLNPNKFNLIKNCFIPNSISSQTTYSFIPNDKSELGKRFMNYERLFDVYFNKNELYVMPEDCIQFISIEGNRRYKFIDTWSKCIQYKKEENMGNTPAGNIDEMCFAGLYNAVDLNNNSHIEINIFDAKHDKWYI